MVPIRTVERSKINRLALITTLGGDFRPISMPVVISLASRTRAANKKIRSLVSSNKIQGRSVRGRIESILDWAKVRGYRDGENPARWRGHLAKLLPARAKVREVKHHAALPYDDLSDFMTELRAQESIAPLALQFTILTAARTGEVIGAKWNEINLNEKVWIIPAGRMKAGKEHRVPLSGSAVAILEMTKAEGEATDGFVFSKRGKPLSNMAMTMTLRRMDRGDLTVHGFRSTFRDWAAERTNFPSEIAEMALAHAVGSKVEAAYRRGDLFDHRRRIMAEWAKFCATPADQRKVLTFGKS
jgi:integrase